MGRFNSQFNTRTNGGQGSARKDFGDLARHLVVVGVTVDVVDTVDTRDALEDDRVGS
jgi:hypothetical protein